ncbi:hypothetical protein MRX96_048336 [Rhipicephalus microplus]
MLREAAGSQSTEEWTALLTSPQEDDQEEIPKAFHRAEDLAIEFNLMEGGQLEPVRPDRVAKETRVTRTEGRTARTSGAKKLSKGVGESTRDGSAKLRSIRGSYSLPSRSGNPHSPWIPSYVWALVHSRLVLINCEDLYAILVSQVVSSAGSTCILTCCNTSDNIRKCKGQERCPHNAASNGKAKAAVYLQAMVLAAAGGITKGDAQHTKLSQHLLSPHCCVQGVNQVVFQVYHEDRYDITVVHVIPNTRRTTTLAFHFVDDSMLKRNPKETCHYPTVSSGVTQGVSVPEGDGSSESSLLTNGCRICVGLALAVSIEDPLAARSKIRFDLGRQRAAYRNINDITSVGNKRRVRSCNHDGGVRLLSPGLSRVERSTLFHAFYKCWWPSRFAKCMGQFHRDCYVSDRVPTDLPSARGH